ncbi:carbohydrate ABC transporter permease [Arthrobacter roseus]|uniref:carbohydrate ABC transporter permease n=1 Tax=Arthrobacter roseus TaxID=136274 RepID=UPI001EF7CC17|nr:carbohydrate ABC transporter permease [Arthrobacter roseus]MBM7846913.1 multiple sugar transport system permease protein [Arthrobacter roseus]
MQTTTAPTQNISRRRRASYVPHYIALLVTGTLFLAPVAYMVAASLAPASKTLAGFEVFDVSQWGLHNYSGVSSSLSSDSTGHLWQFFAVSFTVTVAVVGLGLIVNSMAAYALSRLQWRGQKIILLSILMLLIVPFEAVAVPMFYLYNDARNTLWIQIVPFVGNALAIFLFYSFFSGIPRSIDEAALMDGAGPWKIFWRIIAPMSKPAYASVAILTFLTQWGSFLWPVLMISDPNLRPLPLQISVFAGQLPPAWGQVMAFGVLLVIPVIVVFLIFQRWFIEGVASSAVKG